jgi:hypothetical protein
MTKKRPKNDWEKIADKADFLKDVRVIDDLHRQPQAVGTMPQKTPGG